MANPLRIIPSSFGLRNANDLLLPAIDYSYFMSANRFPFDLAAQQHSPVNAWWLAECALLAYEETKTIERIVTDALQTHQPTFQSFHGPIKGLTGFGVKCKDFSILTFRGTEFYRPQDLLKDFALALSAGKDILQDSKLWTEKCSGSPPIDAHVVRGFYEQLHEVWPEILAWVGTLPAGKKLWLTGHSLGGALAALAAYSLPDRVTGVYTFGCPCIGEQDFAEKFTELGLNERTYRYLHGNDAIAKGLEFPGSWFRHVGQLIEIKADNRKNIIERLVNFAFRRDFTDHAPLYYALHCWNLIPE